jgi:hypothetical protein
MSNDPSKILTYLPPELRAGDTWKWTREAPASFPPSAWTLKYEFQGPEKFTVAATTSGTNFAVTVTAATTKAYPPGIYRWFSYLLKTSDSTERYQLETGQMNVLPDLATAAAGLDARSHAQRTLDLIESAIEALASNAMVEKSIDGHSFRKEDLPTLYSMRLQYQHDVETELAAQKRSQGRPTGRKIGMRFANPS